MARRRFFVPEVRNGQAELEGDEAKHLTQVLRVEAGDIYEISDNEDLYLAEVAVARKAQVIFDITDKLPAPEPMTPLIVLAALIRFERLETMIEKATELAATRIHIVRAERSEKGLELAAPKRLARWQRIALEASQQSRRSKLPEVSGPMSLAQAMKTEAAHRLFLDEERTGKSILDVVTDRDSTAVLVGPEGGWPEHERESALASGWTPVSLGPLVLRSETAAIAALATLNAVFCRYDH
ncbi:MAG: 16S rRNA (uracil(1498)-N(3))-methyltransferase [Bryobacteraceae bacterium]|nr:16S rRNA (uracil(1498)-N(3))-methyltransferase [Bryobacteraceae bacterium]